MPAVLLWSTWCLFKQVHIVSVDCRGVLVLNCAKNSAFTFRPAPEVHFIGNYSCICALIPRQVAVKNNIDVFYFSCQYPMSVLFSEDGKMESKVFLVTWKDIPNDNEAQFQIKDCHLNSDAASNKLQGSNVFTIAKRTVEGQDMLYQSLKLTNGIWVLAELKVQTGNPTFTTRLLRLEWHVPSPYQSTLSQNPNFTYVEKY
uniref:Beta-adaptin appendage C-terminal subdomain domain-containing protein n=1 Tax=Periophthalmus magnuspinnatus TaxID=409849 RepID=A0A3B3ZE89_9GOBI